MSNTISRREALKKTLFGGVGLMSAASLVDVIAQRNEHIDENETNIAPRSRKQGALALAFGDIYGSRDFPLRDGNMNPREVVATDGARIYFLWPSDRGDARGYIVRHDNSELADDQITFRLRMGRPEAPYYLRWRRGDYYLYTPPGALVKRAAFYIRQNDPDATLQAMSDMRMAVIVNLTANPGADAQDILDELCEIDRSIRENSRCDMQNWEAYRKLLTATNPAL